MQVLIKRLKYYYYTFTVLSKHINKIKNIDFLKGYMDTIENSLKALNKDPNIKDPDFIIALIPLNIEVFENFIRSILIPGI